MAPLPPFPWIDVAIIFALIVLNGVFAMSELAIVSSRKARLEAMARAKKRGARTALALAADPGKILSATQIGITLIGILAGAYSGASLGGPVAARLAFLGLSPETTADGRFRHRHRHHHLCVARRRASWCPSRSRCARPSRSPRSWQGRSARSPGAPPRSCGCSILSSGALFRLMGLKRETEDHVTAEELHLIVAEASKSGVIEEHERSIISGVVRLADRPVREVMTPRTDVEWIDATLDDAGIRAALMAASHSRMPVADGSVDSVIGVVQARDIAVALFKGEPLDLRVLMRQAPVVIDQIDAMDALDALRQAEVPMALIHDEYGHFEGIVTPADLLAAIAGEFASDTDPDEAPSVVEREDGSLLVAGQMAADALAERLGIDLPEDRDYATVAGLALAVFRHLPGEGESFVEQGWKFEVVDLDGRRIDKLLVSEARKRR